MPYTPDTWADLDPTKVVSAARMTKLGGQYAAAMADFAGLYGADARPWLPSTAYAAGQFVISPVTGDLVSAKTAHTSGSTYSGITASGNWNPSRKTTMNAADYGVVGNGTTDDAAALNALLSSAATFGASVTLAAGSTVLISSVTITVPSGTRLDLNGATIKSALPGTSDRLVTVSGVSNVIIRNGILDGNKAGFGTATEQRHNLLISNSSNVTVRDVKSINAKGDGIYVGDNLAGPSSNITIDNVVCDSNWRQGMSISHVDGMEVINSIFSNTAGTAPQSGVDVEPNSASVVCQNIKFTNCTFNGNAGSGFLVVFQATPTARQGGIDLEGCTFTGNTADGIQLNDSADVRVIGGEARSNLRGIRLTTAKSTLHQNVHIDGMQVSENLNAGIALTYGVNGLTIANCDVRDNGQATANTYNGIDLSPSVASTNIRIIANKSAGAQQKNGLLTTANCSNVTMLGNQYENNTTAATSLADDLITRVMFGRTRAYLPAQISLRSGGGSTLVDLWTNGDTNARLSLRNDGHILIGAGSAAADVDLSRGGSGLLAMGAANTFKTGQNVTGSRPAAATVGKGAQFYDTTLNKPIWSDGTNWKDAAGTTV